MIADDHVQDLLQNPAQSEFCNDFMNHDISFRQYNFFFQIGPDPDLVVSKMTIVVIVVNRVQDRVQDPSQEIAIMISIMMTTMMPLTTTILVMKTATVLITEPMRMTIWSLKIDLIQHLILSNKLFLYEKKE